MKLLISLPSLVGAVIFLGMALFVFFRAPKWVSNRAFSLGLLSLFILGLGNFLSLVSSSPSDVLFWQRISLVGQVCLPANCLLFSVVFGRGNGLQNLARWKPILILIYLISLAFLALIPSDRFLDGSSLASESLGLEFIPIGGVGRLFYVFSLLVSVLILAQLENTLRSAVEPKRSQIRLLFLGIGGIFAFLIYLSSQVLLYSQWMLDHLFLTSLVHLVCLGMMVFSLTQYGLQQKDIFVSPRVLYHSLTFLAVGGYLLAIGFLTQWLQYLERAWISHISIFLVFLCSLGVVGFLLSTRCQNKIKAIIGTHFYRSKYDHRTLWQRFAEKLGPGLGEEEILSLTEELLLETLEIKGIGYWLYDHNRRGFYPARFWNFFKNQQMFLKEEGEEVRYLMEVDRPVTIEEIRYIQREVSAEKESLIISEMMDGLVWVPLKAGDKKVGLIALWKGIGKKGFDREDCELLKTLSALIAHHLLTARLSQELIAVKQVEAFSRLSAFVMHDLKNFASSLSLVVQNAGANWDDPEFREDALETISETVAKMKNLTSKLSTGRTEKLQCRLADLNVLISETIHQLNGRGGGIKFFPEEGLLPVELDYDEMQKVLLNLLLNAREAISDQGEVVVRTEAGQGWVAFSVADNGCGMSEEFMADSLFVPFKTTKKRGTGIGLYQCKQVVEAHQGEIEVESRSGQGSTFRVKLPVVPVT